MVIFTLSSFNWWSINKIGLNLVKCTKTWKKRGYYQSFCKTGVSVGQRNLLCSISSTSDMVQNLWLYIYWNTFAQFHTRLIKLVFPSWGLVENFNVLEFKLCQKKKKNTMHKMFRLKNISTDFYLPASSVLEYEQILVIKEDVVTVRFTMNYAQTTPATQHCIMK